MIKKLGMSMALLAGVLVTDAQAREFYTVKVKAKLYYSTITQDRKKMGTLTGELRAGDDGAFATLILGDKEYPIQLQRFSKKENRRPVIRFAVDKATMQKILHETNHAWYRERETRTHVGGLIDRILAAAEGKGTVGIYEMAAEYTDYSYGSDEDQTVASLQFHDNESPESLHLVVDFGNRVSVN
jgi:hypothetical protein